MKLNYTHLLNFIFPQTDDEKRIKDATPDTFRTKYAPFMVHANMWAIASFKDRDIRSAVHLVKFHHHPHAVSLLSSLLNHYLRSLPQRSYTLVPVPLSSSRERERGFNQVEVLARASIKDLPFFTLHTQALRKERDTKPQSSLSRKERLHNVAGAFTLIERAKAELAHTHVVLLDDVLTTGSTLSEARKAVAQARPLSITCVAIAH